MLKSLRDLRQSARRRAQVSPSANKNTKIQDILDSEPGLATQATSESIGQDRISHLVDDDNGSSLRAEPPSISEKLDAEELRTEELDKGGRRKSKKHKRSKKRRRKSMKKSRQKHRKSRKY